MGGAFRLKNLFSVWSWRSVWLRLSEAGIVGQARVESADEYFYESGGGLALVSEGAETADGSGGVGEEGTDAGLGSVPGEAEKKGAADGVPKGRGRIHL